LGQGDYKYYYTQERDRQLPESTPAEFQRYLIRWRHKWDIDTRTKATLEYWKIVDSRRQWGTDHTFLKDYFYREYETDAQPQSYALLSHAFDYASLNFFLQKRTNRWYDTMIEKLPEITLGLPAYNIGNSPAYFNTSATFSNLNRKYPAPSDLDDDVIRFDTYNKLSLPTKVFIFWLNPYVGLRETYYSKDSNGDSLDPRTVFYSGADLSTKFYRLFDFKSNFLGMDINGLRHIISPVATFAYIHNPTIPSAKLQQFDTIDSISTSNKVTLELVNTLQTKRTDKAKVDDITDNIKVTKVDFATFKVTSDYRFKPKGGTGSSFSDFLFDLELLPYSWMRIESDAIYNHLQDEFTQVDIDMLASFGTDRSFGIGHRYARKGGKELTAEFIWRLSPKWKFRIYERYQIAEVSKKGIKEQEYGFSRDLHCWIMDFNYNVSLKRGHSFWFIFRIKAFPEMEFGFDQTYHAPKPGSTTNP
jgi:hypothetical protein